MRIVALDLSLTATGYAISEVVDGDSSEVSGVLSPPSSHGRGVKRLQWIRDAVYEMVPIEDPVLVVVEGFSYGSKGKAVFDIAGLGWIVRMMLYEMGVRYVEVPPASLKKYATGKGNAGKVDVLLAAVKRLGYEGNNNNETDALWLMQMAAGKYDFPCAVTVPEAHRVALAGVVWPDLDFCEK